MDSDAKRRERARDEMNIAEFALCGVRARDLDDEGRYVVYQGTVWDPDKQATVPRELIIEGSAKFGLPHGTDDDVLLACIKLSREGGFKSRRIVFSAYQLLKELGWSDGGERFERLRDGLRRWSKIRIHSERHFWDHERQCFYDEDFGIVDTLRVPRAKRERWELVWSDGFWRSLRSGYVRSLDWEFYLSLSSHVAKRLYRLLGKRFYRDKQHEFRFELEELCVRHVGLTGGKATTNMKRELLTGIKELETKWPLLKPAALEDRFQKVKPGCWEVVFHRGERPRRDLRLPSDEKLGGIETELVSRGVTATVAEQLVSAYPKSRVMEKVELYDWYLAKKDKRMGENPAGFLVTAIKEDYGLPKGFETKAQREAKLKKKIAREEQKRREFATEANRVTKEREERLIHEETVKRHMETLSEFEQGELLKEALSKASETDQKFYTNAKKMGLDAMLREVSNRVLFHFLENKQQSESPSDFQPHAVEESVEDLGR